MAMNTSSKYDNITCKRLIQSGPPAVYQLDPKKQNIGTIRKVTLGDKCGKETKRTILLVGETGTGKSTLINTLVNYDLGVEWDDNVWFKIVEEEEKSESDEDEDEGQCQSQTPDVIVYEIFGFEGKTLPYSLTIIDTPGYGDTSGAEHDEIVSRRLLDLFCSEDGVHEINVIGLVLKASENRLSDRLRYIFDSVVSLFGKDVENNIVALITHSDGITPKNALRALKTAKIKCAKDQKDKPVHFLFNNRQKEDRTKNPKILQNADEVTMEGMKQFTDFLGGKAPQKLETTSDVLSERITLKACIQNLKQRVELIEFKQEEIKQTQEALKIHVEEMKRNEDFTIQIDEPYKDKEPINGGNMQGGFFDTTNGAICCLVCEENCHDPCTQVPKPGSCKVMRRGRCVVCTKKCPVAAHVKETWRYVTKTRKLQKTLRDVKEKYDRSKAACEETKGLLKTLEQKMEELTKEKSQWLVEAFQHVLKLEEIALNAKSLSTHVHLDFLIENIKEKGDTEKVQRLEEIKNREDEGTRAGLRYMISNAPAAVGKVLTRVKDGVIDGIKDKINFDME